MIGDLGREELHSYLPAQFSVLRSVDFTHTSRTDFINDAIAG